MNHLILVRHGEAEHLVGDDESRMTGGWTDSSLTERGRRQAESTGLALRHLLNVDFSIYASDLVRCGDTAKIISKHLAVQPTFVPHLRELNNGIAANHTQKQAKALELPRTEPGIDWVHYPEAESWGAMHDRVIRFMERIQNDQSETILIISHGGPIRAIIHWWLALPRSMYSTVSFDIEPCSITCLTVNRFGEKTISKLNSTCHLSRQDEIHS